MRLPGCEWRLSRHDQARPSLSGGHPQLRIAAIVTGALKVCPRSVVRELEDMLGARHRVGCSVDGRDVTHSSVSGCSSEIDVRAAGVSRRRSNEEQECALPRSLPTRLPTGSASRSPSAASGSDPGVSVWSSPSRCVDSSHISRRRKSTRRTVGHLRTFRGHAAVTIRRYRAESVWCNHVGRAVAGPGGR